MKSHYQAVIFDWEGTIGDISTPYVYTASHGLPQVALLPGARSCIEQLAQAHIKLAIATNKSARSLTFDLEASGLKPYFKITRSASETAPKPDPQMLLEILACFDLLVSSALMIGDSFWDMEMAQKIQMDCIGIDFSCQNEASLLASGAKKVFQNYTDVLAFILPETK